MRRAKSHQCRVGIPYEARQIGKLCPIPQCSQSQQSVIDKKIVLMFGASFLGPCHVKSATLDPQPTDEVNSLIYSQVSVKNLVQPRLLAFRAVTLSPAVVRVFKVGLAVIPCRWRRHRCDRCGYSGRTIQKLVEFTPVKPDAAASGTVVNFDTLSIRHHQGCIGAARTFHCVLSLLKW